MNALRRFPSVFVLCAGLAVGCANSQQFTAGRLPYGSTAGPSPQDPFLSHPEAARAVAAARTTGENSPRPAQPASRFAAGAYAPPGDFASGPYSPPTALAAAPSGPPPGMTPPMTPPMVPPTATPYQTAYAGRPENPFAVDSAAAAPAPATTGVAQTNFEMPVATRPQNPFAQNSSAQNPFAEVENSSVASAPAAGDVWEPRASTALSSEEFLPPR